MTGRALGGRWRPVVEAGPLLRIDGLTKRYPGVDRARRPDRRGAARAHRPRRRERRRQDDDVPPAARARAPDRRAASRCAASTSRATRSACASRLGYMPEHDCLPLDQTAADVVSTFGELSGLPARAARAAGVRHPRPRRARRGPLPADQRVLDRHAPAHEARAGARRRSRAGAARRADRRARPARPRGDAGARRPARHVRHLGADGDPPARRRAAGVRPRRDDRRRPARRRRAPTDSLLERTGHRHRRRRAARRRSCVAGAGTDRARRPSRPTASSR